MVLLYGIPGDGPFEMVADALEELSAPFLILNPRKFNDWDFILHMSPNGIEGEITVGAKSYSLSAFTGIYNRSIDFSLLPETQNLEKDSKAYQQKSQMFELFHQWMEIGPCRVVNKGTAMSSNASKPFQLNLIQPFFALPDTIITNNPAEAQAFANNYDEVIYKSVSSIRSIVKTIKTSEQRWQNIRYCPTLFQERLVGHNYRVHVIETKIFAVKIQSEIVDYRYSNREGKETTLHAVELPPDIAEKCITLAATLQLPFAGIDLFLTESGKWYCFEVNPSPGFSYFEKNIEQPIAKAVAEYLMGRS